MTRIVAFNWPKLVGGSAVALAGWGVGSSTRGPYAVAGAAVAVGTTYFLVASLTVSWWVYDRSDLHQWAWMAPMLAGARNWAMVHAGFDEAGTSLPAAFGPPALVVDISSWLGRTSPSLRRARRRHPAPASALVRADGGLPMGSSSSDAILLVFAAHEVRQRPRREFLFDELRRVVTPSGRVVLVEHHRGWANLAAFGPAAWHFQTRREWLRLADRSGFDVAEVKMTPFVRGFSLCPR